MSVEPNLNETDYELLSAYLDGMLTDAEQSALEVRLQQEPTLRRELSALRQTVALVKNLPTMKAPRSFVLTQEMVDLPDTRADDSEMPSQSVDAPSARKVIPLPLISVLSAAASIILIMLGVLLFASSSDEDSEPLTNSVAQEMTPQQTAIVGITSNVIPDGIATGVAAQVETTAEPALPEAAEPETITEETESEAADEDADTDFAQEDAPADDTFAGDAPPGPPAEDDDTFADGEMAEEAEESLDYADESDEDEPPTVSRSLNAILDPPSGTPLLATSTSMADAADTMPPAPMIAPAMTALPTATPSPDVAAASGPAGDAPVGTPMIPSIGAGGASVPGPTSTISAIIRTATPTPDPSATQAAYEVLEDTSVVLAPTTTTSVLLTSPTTTAQAYEALMGTEVALADLASEDQAETGGDRGVDQDQQQEAPLEVGPPVPRQSTNDDAGDETATDVLAVILVVGGVVLAGFAVITYVRQRNAVGG